MDRQLRLVALVTFGAALVLPVSGVSGASVPNSALGGTIPIDPAADAIAADWQKLIAETGALGSYHAEDGTLVVVVPASGSSRFHRSDAAAFGVDVRIEERDIEPEDVAAIMKAVDQRVDAPIAFFSARHGVVRVFSDATPAAYRNLVEAFPGKIRYEGRRIVPLSRHADYQPHWGGAEMVASGGSGYDCTSGFSVNNANGNSRVLTAAHCFALNVTVNSPAGSSFGTVKQRDDYPTNDFELVGGGGVDQGPYIYVGNTSSSEDNIKVSGAGDATGFYSYCFSGATTYKNCNQDLVASDVLLCYNPPSCTSGTTHVMVFESPTGSGPCPGDSGSPVFRYYNLSSIQIVGITIAGDSFGGWDQGCWQFADTLVVEKWSKIRDTYNLTIMT